MAFQFPPNPTLDQTYSPMAGTIYSYDGTGWVLVGRAAEDSANFVQRFGDTMTGPLLHPDGTVNAPSIAFAAEPKSGFTRPAANTMQAIIDGAPIWGINKTAFNLGAGVTVGANGANFGGAVSVNGTLSVTNGNIQAYASRFDIDHIVLPRLGRIYFNNDAGSPWTALNSLNTRLQIGEAAGDMTLYAGGAYKIHVHSGGTAFVGTVTGISAAMVGLDQVANARQVYNLRGAAGNVIYIGYTAGTMDLQVDSTYFGITWPINITGYAPTSGNASRAAYVSNGASHTGTGFIFTWSDPGTLPSYVWGSVDGTQMLVYPPSRLSVNYANSCGTAANSNAVCGYGGWRYVNANNNPVYLWGTDGNGNDHFLAARGSMSVNFANSASYATSVGALGQQVTVNYGFGLSSGSYGGASIVINSAQGNNPGIGFHESYVVGWVIGSAGSFRFGNGNSGVPGLGNFAMLIGTDGNVYGRWFNTSTYLATNIRPITGAVLDLGKLRGVRCFNEETQRPDMRVEFDELEFVFPELVNTVEVQGKDEPVRLAKAVNYMALIAPMVEAIRELNERLTAVEKPI